MFDVLKKTIKNSLIYGTGTISSKLIGFILLPLYTSYLSTNDYGVLAIIEISATMLTAVISLKINAAFFRWYYDKNYISKQKSVFFTSVILLFTFNSILFIIFYQFADTFSALFFESKDYSYLLVLMFVSSGLQVIVDLILYLMQLQQKAIYFSTNNIIKLFTALVFTIVFITIFDRKIDGIYEALIISQVIFLIFTAKYLINNCYPKLEIAIFREMLSFSLPLIFAEISGILLTISDRYCLNFLTTTSEVGVYSLGFKVANTIRVFIYSSAMLAVSPLIYQYINKQGNKRFYSKILTYFAFGVMIFTIFLSVFSKELIHIVAQDESFWPAGNLIPVLSFAILFGILKDVILTGLNITKRTGVVAVLIFIMAVINILLNLFFIPLYNAQGAAIATLLTRILSFAVFYIAAQKYYKIPYELKKIIMILASGIILVSIANFFPISNVITSVSLKLILVMLYPVILYYLNFFEPIELERISQSWNKWKKVSNWKENIKKIKIS